MVDMEATTLNSQPVRYTIGELIQMRINLPVVCCTVSKLNKHPDIAVLFRIPRGAFTDPNHYICKSTTLLGINSKHGSRYAGQKNVGGLSEDIDDKLVAVDTASGSQSVKWNLRPRESSDRSSQPHSAPTDLAAQQSENFKRFYRAVVSPSHVRVTAGGRIVPNTRPIGMPLFEWNNEKQIYESRKPSAGGEFKPLRLVPFLPATGFTPTFPQLLPAGFFPAYNHTQSNLRPLIATTVQNLEVFDSNTNLHPPDRDSTVDAVQTASTGQPVRISHPSQFDHSKPFMFNGQLVYPIPPGHLPPSYAHPVPVSMIGNPSPVPSAVPPTGFFMPQPTMPIGPANDLNAAHYSQDAFLSHSNSNLPTGNGGLYNQYLPIAGPASVTDITRFQIEGFRNHLNFINEQIANNQLGIDVQYLEGQQSDLKALIERMESMLTLQLAYGRRQDAGAFLNGAMQLEAQNQLAKGTMGEAVCQVGKTTEVSPSTRSKEEPVPSSLAPKHHLNKLPTCSASRLAKGENTAKGHTQPSSAASKSRLTPAAAMAPPFQPRPQAMVAANSFSGVSALSTHRSTYTASFGPRITSCANGTYTPSHPGAGYGNIPAALSSHRSSAYTQNEDSPATIPGIHTTDAPYTAPSDQKVPLISPAAVPYLVGTVPHGVQGIDSKATVHQYPRPLTDEELRARFLYWGRAPRSAYDGLPKFDGKDFYPPSPTKEPARLRTNSPIANSHIPRHLTPIERNFEKLFAAPGSTNSKVASSDLASGYQNGRANTIPTAYQRGNVGSFRSHRSPNTPKGHPNPWLLKDHGHSQAKYGPGTGQSIGHSEGSPTLPDLSKLLIDAGSSQSNSPGSARLSVRRFNSDTARAKNDSVNVQLRIDKVELGGQADSVGSRRASTKYYDVGIGKAEHEVGKPSSPRDIRSTSSIRGVSGRPSYEHNLMTRIESSSTSEQHGVFLQNMLKSSAHMGMAAPALRTVSSATAHGFLPLYRGSAAASLAPAMLIVPGAERNSNRHSLKIDQQGRSGEDRAAFSGIMTENQPLKANQSPGPLQPTRGALDAEGYMRYLTQRADEERRITEHGWNANASGSTHAPSSYW